MEKHIDVLGYLLTALVFSVGFLSARVHSTFETTVREVGDLSWRVRQELVASNRLSPTDLGSLLAVVWHSDDPVADATRYVNLGILLASSVVFGDGVFLLVTDTDGPPHALGLLVVVLLSSVAVILISEADLRRVRIDQRSALAESTLGRLQALGEELQAGDLVASQTDLEGLRKTYPGWGLLRELEAYVLLRADRPQDALEHVERIIGDSEDLYISAPVGTAAALAVSDDATARRLLDRMVALPSVPHAQTLRRALGVADGELSALFEATTAADAPAPGDRARRAAELWRDETRDTAGRRVALDVTPADLPETAGLLHLRAAWERGESLDDVRRLADGTALHALLELLSDGSVTRSAELVASSEHADTIEALGMAQLAVGSVRDAVRSFERAIRLRPASAHAHWAMAMGSFRLGWSDAALTSARRSDTLAPDDPLINLTLDMIQGVDRTKDQVARMFPAAIGAFEQVHLGLLGLDLRTGTEARTARDQAVNAFVDAALRSIAASRLAEPASR